MTDKIDRLLEAAEHPDRFSDAELNALLTDRECKEMYDLMSRAADALTDVSEPDIDAEWQRFLRQGRRQHTFAGLSRRNAAAAAIVVLASLALVAATLGVRLNFHTDTTPQIAATELVAPEADVPTVDELTEPTDSAATGTATFRDATLADVLQTVAAHYDAKVVYANEPAKDLRLYFRWNRELSLSEIVEQLNKFDRINIKLNNNELTVE